MFVHWLGPGCWRPRLSDDAMYAKQTLWRIQTLKSHRYLFLSYHSHIFCCFSFPAAFHLELEIVLNYLFGTIIHALIITSKCVNPVFIENVKFQ